MLFRPEIETIPAFELDDIELIVAIIFSFPCFSADPKYSPDKILLLIMFLVIKPFPFCPQSMIYIPLELFTTIFPIIFRTLESLIRIAPLLEEIFVDAPNVSRDVFSLSYPSIPLTLVETFVFKLSPFQPLF